MFSLWQYQRLAEGDAYESDLTPYARRTWRRSWRAPGGCWMGDFAIVGAPIWQLKRLYSILIGKLIKEMSFGMCTWEGEIVELRLTIRGKTETISLDPELWQNRVACQHIWPVDEDEQQGVLVYEPPATSNEFQDNGQDFSDWETNPAVPGDAVYQMFIINDDDSEVQCYIGNATSNPGANDSFVAYKSLDLDNPGFNGDIGGKTALTYKIKHVENSGQQMITDWSENTESSDIYGESAYLHVMADEAHTTTAEAERDRRIAELAYPRGIVTGGMTGTESGTSRENRLEAMCAGLVFGMNRRYYLADVIPYGVGTQIATLIAASEFITAGSLDANATIKVPIACADIPSLLWEQILGFIDMGDVSGNRWTGGVVPGQVFDYKPAETVARYYWREGRLLTGAGLPVYPTLIRPDIIVERMPAMYIPAPGANVWDKQTYIQEVEFSAPNKYRLIPAEGDILVGEF